MSHRTLLDPEPVIDAALAARDAGRGEQAIGPLRAAIAVHPANPRLWQTLGVLCRALDDSAGAIDAFSNAARLAPGDLRAAYGVAQSNLEAGRPAVALFERARTLAPADGSLLLGQSAAMLAVGRLADAIALFDIVVSGNPLWLDGQAALARLRWLAGDTAGFAAGYRRALGTNRGALALWLALINTLIHAERYGEAAAAIVDARAGTGAVDALDLPDAICASERGDRDVADRLFARLTRTGDVSAIERQLRHLLRTSRADEAARYGELAVAAAGGERIWPYLSLAWRLLGDPRWDWLEGDPALIRVAQLDDIADLALLASRLRAIHRAMGEPLGQSVRGGTQTDGPLFAREEAEIRQLRVSIVAAVRTHLSAIGQHDPRHPTLRHVGKRFRFAGSWSVRLTGAGRHSNHIHPEGWISSAFYVALPEQKVMGPEPAGWLQLGQPPVELGLDLPPIRRIPPRPGQLVLFPSTMWHGTEPIAAGERLSVAFDVAAIG